ncbi:MAG TPA: helix-turn-helix transcriptional regulator [Thermoanaerobaculia bacterium]|nr:helix-turn-helix transcriptional regulator [Thermoanaerobaculia bacterium]
MREDEKKRALKLLSAMIQMAGLTRQDLDQKLVAGRGYTSQVLTGRVELKFQHILEILEALGVETEVFFHILYPPPAERRAGPPLLETFLERLHRAGADEVSATPVPPPQPAETDEELERQILAAVRSVLRQPPQRF